ncbi:MAG TPA: carbohydrate porin [Aquabacterium sp.]|uniref:carbohydrate porin n=1 Tax=Aquabacterium sp. TaxID=1872578 RepID=UPI002E2FCC3B|nr:carbohydrate porin [Aquabacterium sp.]HEX5372537.1 carbohydrate porin [Aquabacterium sp.]
MIRSLRPVWMASALACLVSPAVAGASRPSVAPAPQTATQAAVLAQVQQLMERVRQLEQSNQELSRRISELSATERSRSAPTVVSPVPNEVRLQALEQQVQGMAQQVTQGSATVAPPDSGPRFEGSLVALAQQVNARGSDTGRRQSAVNYRGDLVATLSAGALGQAQGTLVGHLRFGQGTGLSIRPSYSSTVNSTTFEAAAGSDDTYAIVAEAHYTLDWVLGGAQAQGAAAEQLSLTVGKMDVFGFFDQNAVAADESAAFLNNAFVHNPLLDSGGDIAADGYGFAPGLRLSYVRPVAAGSMGVSLGVFAAGDAARFGSGWSQPLVMGQLDWSPVLTDGEPQGAYRLYAWTNGRTLSLDEQRQRHSGWGVSADQRVGAHWHLFGRWGQRTAGDGPFDRALTLGFEYSGAGWGRASDALGLAQGWIHTSQAWRDGTADGSFGTYAASGSERITELYYRVQFNEQLSITPDYQFVQRAGGDDSATQVHVLGVRATLGF